MNQCQNCGSYNDDYSVMCGNCGQPLSNTAEPAAVSQQTAYQEPQQNYYQSQQPTQQSYYQAPQPTPQPSYYQAPQPTPQSIVIVNDAQQLPPQYRPLGAWAYFGYSLLYSLPIIGWILLIVFALSDSNINRRNHARSFFCIYVVAIIAVVIIAAVTGGLFFSVSRSFR